MDRFKPIECGLEEDYNKTIADYSNNIERDPKDVRSYIARGNAWFERGDCNNAIDDYTKAIEIDPNFAEAYSCRGIAWSKTGYHGNALVDFSRAIEIIEAV
ncbi:hypothetical protein MBAV_005008 [Candidatus Magnetobacterium bavaricum]|uniref:Uncharacterized protein n=1 Tax=Candidatus Magnetobacterium bavaricum TaxID=29290 RepID=A0A0F3GQ77_9BACT|nr:hypothetical protein MBAV_005008 [Candidatus Magnetobacterium bavaricum]